MTVLIFGTKFAQKGLFPVGLGKIALVRASNPSFKGRFVQNQKIHTDKLPLMSLSQTLVNLPSKHILFPIYSLIKFGYY